MAEEKLNEAKIKDILLQFNLDESLNALKRYYSTPTTWDIIHQARWEKSHTLFLAWFFGNNDFNDTSNVGPIQKLIVLLLKWKRLQKGAQFDNELESSIYAQNFSIRTYKVMTEYPIYTQDYGKGNMDIFIACEAEVNGSIKNINIAIENKVDSPETTKDVKGNRLYQTDAYYEYVSENCKNDINLFVYLKPTHCDLKDVAQAECSCKKYIQLNYQELLDDILQPTCELSDISFENRFRLEDYIKTLGKPSETNVDSDSNNNNNKHIMIMAMGQKEKELLDAFFKRNENLIRAAIKAQGDDELSMALEQAQVGRAKRLYTINQEGSYRMHDVIVEFVKYRLKNNPSVSVKDIDDEIRNYIGGSRVNVTDDSSVELPEGRFKSFYYGDRIIRYTTQWGDAASNITFSKFREGVNSSYPDDFQIQPV